MQSGEYLKLASHYDLRLKLHGDTAKGADWPNQTDREVRFDVLLDVLARDPASKISLLDFGCGTGDLLRFIQERRIGQIDYRGVDISHDAIHLAKQKFPDSSFAEIDLLKAAASDISELAADYCIINGLFTVRSGIPEEEMWSFLTEIVSRLWNVVGKGIAFNVMSKQVDYERIDLFHVPFDRVAQFLHSLAGRNISFRADYGLYEYSCFAFKQPWHIRFSARSEENTAHASHSVALKSEASGFSAICRPLLPPAEQLFPYLKTIDVRRWYSNWGELNGRFEARLCTYLGLPERCCVTASTGTDAITAALIAVAGRASPDRPFCLMPSYTFVATAVAALNAGYTPYLLDIDKETFALDLTSVQSHAVLAQAGAVIVVAPYGQPVDVAAWQRFSRRTGVPVIVDAAAGFDTISAKQIPMLDDIPVIISFHATKVFGTGEGGAILCKDPALVQRCRQSLNYGFSGDRRAAVTGINGKLSEYHAAVGLAELDGWADKRAQYLRVAEYYWRAACERSLERNLIVERGWASAYALYFADSVSDAEAATRRLSENGIDYRYWYGDGISLQPAYAQYPADSLEATVDLSPRLVGLPCSLDLSAEAINFIVEVLAHKTFNAPTPPSSVA